MRKVIVTSALAALSLAALSTPASAETVSIVVPYGDLNLSSAKGMATLERRVERAIDRICGNDSRPLHLAAAQQQCADAAKASADAQIARLTGREQLALSARR
jgi:UrcA family protein